MYVYEQKEQVRMSTVKALRRICITSSPVLMGSKFKMWPAWPATPSETWWILGNGNYSRKAISCPNLPGAREILIFQRVFSLTVWVSFIINYGGWKWLRSHPMQSYWTSLSPALTWTAPYLPRRPCHLWIAVAHWRRPDVELKFAFLELPLLGNKCISLNHYLESRSHSQQESAWGLKPRREGS